MDVAVRFAEKDATVRYLPGKVDLDQILKRYDDTPFDVSPTGPVVSVVRANQLTVRGWSKRTSPVEQSPDVTPEKQAAESKNEPAAIEVFVELLPANKVRLAEGVQLSVSAPETAGLHLLDAFTQLDPPQGPAADGPERTSQQDAARRFVARLTEAVAMKPGQTTVPIRFRVPWIDGDNQPRNHKGTLDVVVLTPRAPQSVSEAATGVALIGGMLDLRLGHLCDQKGCVEHFHKSLEEIPGLAGVLPHPNLQDPRATVYLRARQPLDVWKLREKLRARGVEILEAVPHGLTSYGLRVELPLWRANEQSTEAVQCLECRDRAARVLTDLPWVEDTEISGGGINFRPVESDVDLVKLLDVLNANGTAPRAVWLIPAGAPTPKAAAPQLADRNTGPKLGGSNEHAVVELRFGHTCDVGTDVLSVLGKHAWPSRTHAEKVGEGLIVRASVGDRRFVNLTTLLDEFQSTGQVAEQVRLSECGDIRVQIEFAHICGEVEYSKPPKKATPAEKEKTPVAETQRANDSSSEKKSESDECRVEPSENDSKGSSASGLESPTNPMNEPEKEHKQVSSKPKIEKPFVPKPLRPAKSSHGRQAIEAALARVGWIQRGTFRDYHTRPEFTGPRKLELSLQAADADVVGIDELILALRAAGFPPKSVIVSRRFPGIPFGKPLPGDLLVTDHQGKRLPLLSLRRPGQPLAVAFISLKCPRHEKYAADAKLYRPLARTIEKYGDQVSFVAISANAGDKFADVVEFWNKAGMSVPLLQDADGQAAAVFNSQVTPPPHMFVFDADARLRYAGDPHNHWEEPEKPRDDFLDKALERVLAGTYQTNGAVFFNKSVCNCSAPHCACPKCGCGATCRCAIKH